MTKYFLKELSIEGFRGINNENSPLSLKFKTHQVNSIFGGNACGKSSIFDALCYAIKGEIPKLSQLNNSEQAKEYYCNKFHSQNIARIIFKFKPDDSSDDIEISIERSNTGSKTVASSTSAIKPEEFLKNLDGEVILLDNNSFQSFIEESPLNRGRTFSGLLGYSNLSEYRRVLETLANNGNLSNDFDLARDEQKKADIESNIQSQLTTIKSKYKEIKGQYPVEPIKLDVINSEITIALSNIDLVKPFAEESKNDLLKMDFSKIKAKIASEEGGETKEKYTLINRDIAELNKLKIDQSIKNGQDLIEQNIKSAQEKLKLTKGPLFQKLYETTKVVLESEQWSNPNQCPACEAIDTKPLITTIKEALNAFSQSQELFEKIAADWSSSVLAQRIKILEGNKTLNIDESTKQYIQLNQTFIQEQPCSNDYSKAVQHLNKLEVILKTKLSALETEKSELEKTLPPSLVQLTNVINTAEELNDTILAIEKKQKELFEVTTLLDLKNQWKIFIQTAEKVFSEAETAFSTQETISISNEYKSLYQSITNNPDIVPILEKANKTEELSLRLEEFYGQKNLSATTLLSESYRNALAFSIFMSTIKRNNSSARFIVLDDVTSSFDAGHQFNIMEILKNQIASSSDPNGPQVIILSHDTLLEKYFDTLSNTDKWHHQKLQGLPPMGNVLCNSQDASRIRTEAEKFLNSGLKDSAAPLIRQYLEFKLQEIIRKVNITVPIDFAIRDDRKMIQNCVDAIENAVNLHKAAGDLIIDNTNTQNFLNTLVPHLVSNWISHYATNNVNSLSPHVLKDILNKVDDIADCFKYDCKCSGSIQRRYYKDLTSKQCNCL